MGLALVLAASGTSAIAQLRAVPAAATTSTSLVTAATRQGLADAVNSGYFPSGSTTAVVAEDSAAAVHLASSYAAVRQLPVIVATAGTTTTDVTNRLSTLHATHAVLVSATPSWFTTTFPSALTAAGVTTDAYIESSDPFTRWTIAAGTTAPEYALARSDNATAVALATSYAEARRLPLVVWEPTTAASTLASFFTAVDGKRLTFFDPSVVPGDQLTSNEGNDLTTVDLTDLKKAFTWVAAADQAFGAISNRIITAASDSVDELGLAGVAAAKAAAVVAPAGARASLATDSRANEYLGLWVSNTDSIAVIGTNFTATDVSSITAPTATVPAASPAFRVTDLTRTSTTFTIGLTSVASATSYQGYNAEGTLIATSSTPSLTFSAPVASALVVANGPSGELARIDVHANNYDATGSLENVAFIDASGGTNHLRLLGSIHTPRLITRITNDPFGAPPDNLGSMTPIAITCATDYTDVTGDGSKEYLYEVSNLTNVDVRACGSSYPIAAATATEGVQNAKVTAPPTDIPCFCMRANTFTKSVATTDRKAGVSMAQKMIENAESPTSADGKFARRGPGDGWAPILTRWMAYIPESKVLFGPYPDINRPFHYFAGDGHGTWNPNESARFKQDVTWTFGSGHSVNYSEFMGTSYGYKCQINATDCVQIESGTAPLSQLNATSLGSGATWGSASLRAEATIPLVSFAPPIDTKVDIYISNVVSYVRGYHDNMPKHEFYIGTPNSEYLKIYESNYVSAVQLPCLYSSPDLRIPGCGITFNAMI